MALPKMTALHKIHKGKILPCQNSNNFVGTNSFLGVFDRESCFSVEQEIFHCVFPSPVSSAVLRSLLTVLWQPCLVTCIRFLFSPTALVSLLIC